MRVLKIEMLGELGPVEQFGKDIKPYASLSHTWGSDQDQITFKDMKTDACAGYKKLSQATIFSTIDKTR